MSENQPTIIDVSPIEHSRKRIAVDSANASANGNVKGSSSQSGWANTARAQSALHVSAGFRGAWGASGAAGASGVAGQSRVQDASGAAGQRRAWSPFSALGGVMQIVVGAGLIALGVPMLILPGPGLLSIGAGALLVARGASKVIGTAR